MFGVLREPTMDWTITFD